MIAGMDEAGRGPAIGPLVFGIVLLTEEQENILKEKGIKDSKQLSRKKRQEYKSIIEEYAEIYATLVVSAKEIDHQRENITLNEIEVTNFQRLLSPYADKITTLQLDAADVNAERFGKRFEDIVTSNIDSQHKGDSIFIAVGAASILAKVERDRIIDELQEEMNKIDPDLPSFGSGYPVQAKPFLEAFVKKYDKLPHIARHSWKTSKDAFEKFGPIQKSLDDFI